ncbi:thiolase family protein [Nocardioides terrisoli]|uniref:thiolase family protein n=1 Tax=Nocardioides terrisoli TaxID=3388267 RepID=UPI00287B6A64|nr:thiolase family protein [Nocardioides marmorisolisilvae]
MSGPVRIAGVGMTAFGRHPESTFKELSRDAITSALGDADAVVDDIQAVFFGNSTAGAIWGQDCIRGETVTHEMGFGSIAVNNVENACATGGNALHLAWASVASGQYETVLAAGCEKLTHPDKTKSFRAFRGGIDLDYADFGDSEVVRSPFIDRYALVAAELMTRGVSPESFAILAAKARSNGELNPLAHHRTALSVEAALAARMVLAPLTVAMCSPLSDGAAAVVVTSRRGTGPQIEIRGSSLRSLPRDARGPCDAHADSAQAAYDHASLGPEDIDFAELHDATSPGEMVSWVQSGLCPAGDEEEWARTGHTELTGAMPINPSGGLVARGHPIGATGLAQAYEAVQQLRGTAGGRQLDVPRVALIQCGGGLIKRHTAVSSAHVLVKG